MRSSRPSCFALVFMFLTSWWLGGCSRKPPLTAPPSTGTIVIDAEPDAIHAMWSLTGPESYLTSGSGDLQLKDLEPGKYTLKWDEVEFWDLPNPQQQTKELSRGGTVSFKGEYSRPMFVHISPGSFTMGSPPSESGRYEDETQHIVTLTRGFFMSKYEVTEKLWDSVMGDGTSTDLRPKGGISWKQAIGFCNQLSISEGLTPAYIVDIEHVEWNQEADGYRLPTEAEWEYACRAGSDGAFANGAIVPQFCEGDPTLAQIAWYCGSIDSDLGAQPVGGLRANDWGLYDMHGNVAELCWDGYKSDYENLPATDPSNSPHYDNVVARGGSVWDNARDCRSAKRIEFGLQNGYPAFHVGFRLVMTAF